MATGLTNFYALLREITKIAAWVLPTAGLSPVIASLIGINPPWPNKAGLTVCTSAIVLFALVIVFQLSCRAPRRVVDRTIVVALIALVVGAACYFVATAVLTYATPVTKDVFAKGFVCTDEARLLYASKCPWLDLDELKASEYEAVRLWTLPSIAGVKVLLLFAWFWMFGAGAVCLGTFVVYQSRQRQRVDRSGVE